MQVPQLLCRASNYVGFLRKALREAGFEQVAVISVSTQGIEKNPGFTFSYDMLKRILMAILLGDLLMRVSLRIRPYEKIKNSTNILVDEWIDRLLVSLEKMTKDDFVKYVNEIVQSFDKMQILYP